MKGASVSIYGQHKVYMKYQTISAALALLVNVSSASASLIAGDLPARAGEDGLGIDYAFQMYLDPSSGLVTENQAGPVGSKAWSDPSNINGSNGIPLGWTHTSVWGYIRLQTDANVQISLSPNGGDLVPAWSLWRGAENDGGNFHTYYQDAVPAWVDAAGFAHIDHVTTGPGPYSGQAATLSLFLTAGEYTIAIGGNDNNSAGHQANYSFSVNASPVPVPSAIYLFASTLAGFLAVRRKHAI